MLQHRTAGVLRRTTLAASVCGGLMVLVACSGASDVTDASGTTTEKSDATQPSPASPTSETTPSLSPTSPASPTSSAPGIIDGDGYSYAVPPGWQDAYEEAKTLVTNTDTAVGLSRGGGYRDNLIVTKPVPAPSEQPPQEITATARQNFATYTDARVRVISSRRIDGERSIVLLAEDAAVQGRSVTFIQYVVSHGDLVYYLTFSYDDVRTRGAELLIDGMIYSWRWE